MKFNDLFRLFVPPIFYHALERRKQRKLLREQTDFKGFISTLSPSQRDGMPRELLFMLEEFFESGSFRYSSNYWAYLNKKNIKQLLNQGVDNVKQTVGRNYNLDTDLQRFEKLAEHIIEVAGDNSLRIDKAQLFRKHDHLSVTDSIQLNTITYLMAAHYFNNGNEVDRFLEEPKIGNPPYITVKNRRVTSELISSLDEYSYLDKHINFKEKNSIIEIGAGYGRTAYVFIKKNPHIKYLICDIPPALYLSKQYLEQCFPEKSACFIPSCTPDVEVRELIFQNDMIFFLPSQLSAVGKVDVFLAIDCLHEMSHEVIEFYVAHAKELADYFYFKCWKNTTIPFDNLTLSESDYIKRLDQSGWTQIFIENCLFPDNYFQALYSVDS